MPLHNPRAAIEWLMAVAISLRDKSVAGAQLIALNSHNTAHILTFWERLYNIITAEHLMDAEQMRYIVIWDNVSFLRSALVQNTFMIIHNFHSNTSRHTLSSLTPLRSFFGMAVEGLRSPALCQDILHSSHEDLGPNCCRAATFGNAWMDWLI